MFLIKSYLFDANEPMQFNQQTCNNEKKRKRRTVRSINLSSKLSSNYNLKF